MSKQPDQDPLSPAAQDMADMLFRGKKLQHEARERTKAERREDIKRRISHTLSAAVPNAIGTIVGGSVLALGATALGVIDDLSGWAVVALVAVVILPIVLLFSLSGPEPFDEDAVRRESEQGVRFLLEIGAISDPSTKTDDE